MTGSADLKPLYALVEEWDRIASDPYVGPEVFARDIYGECADTLKKRLDQLAQEATA